MQKNWIRVASAGLAGFLALMMLPALCLAQTDQPNAGYSPAAEERGLPPSSVSPSDQPAPHRASASVSQQPNGNPTSANPNQPAPEHHPAAFSYSVHPGESLGAISGLFGISVEDLAAANKIDPDDELHVGQILRIPNPFAAQVHDLNKQIDQLKKKTDEAENRANNAVLELQQLKDHTSQLETDNGNLTFAVKSLPWWRGASVTAGIAALLMLGVTGLTLLEWWMMRRKFRNLVEMNESLRRLDYKYKSILSKAELRFQQLYGRRRPGMPEGEEQHVKIAEEIEIERLDRELRDVLEEFLERMGGAKGRRTLRETVANAIEPAEARGIRR